MSLAKLESYLTGKLTKLKADGRLKGNEKIIAGYRAPENGFGPRYVLVGYPDRLFLRMNSNSYLDLSLHPEVVRAESDAAEKFGTGPGAVRFISGTYQPHIELEQQLAAFHGKAAGMIMSAAYSTVMAVLPQFIDQNTLVVSDALNHNCIINAIRLAKPAQKEIYSHLDMTGLEHIIETHKGHAKRACIVTDGIFSMRGDHAPLDKITAICKRHDGDYEQGIITIMDDSHGVGAIGKTGRGTEEYTGAQADLLIATLGKALGVNGGYIVSDATVINYLRETAAFYIYSNPITPAEAMAALKSLTILDSETGLQRLNRIRQTANRLRASLKKLGYETLTGDHPIVAILIRDAAKTPALVEHLFDRDILTTGLYYPVVPKGEEEIRIQISASHTDNDIDYLLDTLEKF